MSQLHLVNKNGRRPRPELVKPIQTDQEAAYYAALELVARIDDELTRGVRHYRTTSGQLLNTLDEVINAMLTNTLELPEVQQAEPMWRREMAA